MNEKLILFFVILFMLSCKKDNSTTELIPKQKDKFSLAIKDSIKLKIPNYSTIERSPVFYYEKDSVNELYFLTSNVYMKQNELIIYDLNTKEEAKKIIFPFEGNDAFPLIHGLTIKSPDSLFTTNYYETNIYLFNSTPNLIDKYSYKYETKNQVLEKLFSNTILNNKIIYNDEKLYFSPKFNSHKFDNKQSLAFYLDLKSNKIVNQDFHFPEDFYKSPYFTHLLSREFNGKEFIYASKKNHNLWVTDIEHKKVKTINAKSRYFKSFSKSKRGIDVNKRLFNSVYYSIYGPIIYDKYRKLYYRFFYPGIDVNKRDKKLMIKSKYKSFFTIMILDQNFKIIDEIVMPKDVYDSNVFFVSKDGLNISTNHINNPTFDENYLKFNTLQLIQK